MVVNYLIQAILKSRYLSFLGNNNSVIPLLVVSNTEYKSTVPAIIGTNVIRLCRQSRSKLGSLLINIDNI